MNRQRRQRIRDAVFRGLRQRVAVRGHQRKNAQNRRRIVELRSRRNVDPPLIQQKIRPCNRRSPLAKLLVEAHRRRQVLHQQRRAPIDHARMAVIGSHPVARVRCPARLQANRIRRRFILRLPVQRVVVAPMPEVQKTSRRRQKIKRRFRISARALEHSAPLPRPFLGFLQVEQQRKPHRQVIVAQPTWTILQVRLQMKDGVAESCMPAARDLAQLQRNRVPLAQHQAWQHCLVQLLVQRKMPSQKAPIQRRQRELQVVRIEPPGFLHRSRTGACTQPNVPHPLDDHPDRVLRVLFSLLVRKGKQHIDVGVGKQILASISAQRKQSYVLRGLAREDSPPHLNQDAVNHSGPAADCGCAVSGAFAGLAHQRHLPHILLPKIVNRQSDWIHEGLCVACRSSKELLTE